MVKKRPKAASSPQPEHQWACPVEGCNYVVTFTTEQSDAALDTIATHKSSHQLEQQDSPPKPTALQPTALETALSALIRSNGQLQQLVGSIAQSSQANAEAIGQLAAQLTQLNQMILESRQAAQQEAQPVSTPGGGGQKSWGPVEIAQVAAALGIGKSGANPMDGLSQFRAMLEGLQPILNWHREAFVDGLGTASDIFTRSARSGLTPEQAAVGLETSVQQERARLQAQAPKPPTP